MPERPTDQYRWIHTLLLEALILERPIRMATAETVAMPSEPFETQTCFRNPVAHDLLLNNQKIAGGAIRRAKGATLYQGSLQITLTPDREARLRQIITSRLIPIS